MLNTVASFIIAALSGLGVGSGGLFVIWLTLAVGTPQLAAQGLNLFFFIFSAGSSLIIHINRRKILWGAVAFLTVLGIIGSLLGSFIAMLLVGMTFIAIGLFVSALTENQLSAAVGTMSIIIVFLAIGIINSFLPANFWLRYVFNCVSIFSRFQTYVNGYFDIASVLYYISISAVFVYLTIRVYDRRRYN